MKFSRKISVGAPWILLDRNACVQLLWNDLYCTACPASNQTKTVKVRKAMEHAVPWDEIESRELGSHLEISARSCRWFSNQDISRLSTFCLHFDDKRIFRFTTFNDKWCHLFYDECCQDLLQSYTEKIHEFYLSAIGERDELLTFVLLA